MTETRILLAGMGPKLSGLTWEANRFMCIGRQNNLDVVLRDKSVERVHAELDIRACAGSCAISPIIPRFKPL